MVSVYKLALSDGYRIIFIATSLGVFFCLLSLLSAVVLGLFDRRASKIMNRAEAKTGMSLLLLCYLIGHFLFIR